MRRIPSLTSRELLAALHKAGYVDSRQTGSHLILKHASRPSVVIPMHARDVNRGTLLRIVRQAGFTTDEFVKLL